MRLDRLAAVAFIGENLRRTIPKFLGDVGIEHRWRLDDVVIDAHKNHVIGIHTNSLRSAALLDGSVKK